MVGSGFPERIGGTISESLLAPDREASRAFPKRAEVDASPVPIERLLSGGDLNRSTQHLLILLDKEVADGDVTDIVHGEAEG